MIVAEGLGVGGAAGDLRMASGREVDVRRATAADGPFLETMLLAAVNWTGQDRFTLEQLRSDPRTAHYLTGWPRPGDFGVLATDAMGEPVGGAWARAFPDSDPGYGFVAPDVPEITIAVRPADRGAGVGRALLAALIEEARARHLHRISLSVEDGNPARDLYATFGFTVAGRNGGSDTMVLDLEGPRARP
jgi:ribosomal protein S18 acetylase RimI-like enzyme